ncbi:transglutaminaseTgpA domain-containing protein [Microbacterium sp. NPDC091382]|uniref:transglutaminase TgpA family protein n=1 Tax=Microbacterium sp. NPDC091382 TaxID=3364210 RepID=UPI00381E3941
MSAERVDTTRPRHDGLSTTALLLALTASLVPLFSVIAGGAWAALAFVLAAILLGAGYLLRRLGVSAVLVTVILVALWTAIMTAVFFSDVAWLFVIPSGEAFARVPRLVEIASNDIAVGVAPLEASASLTFLIVGAVGLLTVALDHVVLTARMPLLAGVALIAVWLIPTLAVPQPVDLWAFALLALALLWLLRTETRGRDRTRTASSPRGGVGAVAAVIAASAVVIALVAAPALPTPAAPTGGLGGGTTIDASLNLGDDLRRPAEVPVVTQWSEAAAPAYLRVATLTELEGDSWQPDRSRSVPLQEWAPEDAAAAGIEVVEDRRTVQVLDLSSAQLPVPADAVSIDGVTGVWRIAPDNGTVVSPSTAARGQKFEVVSRTPRPTLEQARAAEARGGPRQSRELPGDTPPEIADLAAQVTADASNDYDRLLALQTWFRGPDFDYSLEAPVEDGFDGSGIEAVSTFLQVRSGYCVHFASAFAIMARTLDMPSRVVVGFLPGLPTGDVVDDDRVYQATTAQLHAWPEVFFDGIGWVPFEPTKSLGAAQRFASEENTSNEPEPTPTPTAAAEPTPTASSAPRPEDDPTAQTPEATTFSIMRVLPAIGIALGALVVLSLPAFVRGALSRRRMSQARRGSAGAAWRLVQDAAIDLGIPVPESESPRAFGERLREDHGAPASAVERLVHAVERSSYGPPESFGDNDGTELTTDAAAVRTGLFAGVSAPRRLVSRLLPRSLVIRPGSTFAEAFPLGR